METFRCTMSAGDAFCTVDAMTIFVEDMGTMGTDRHAIAALDALMGKKRQFWFRLAALWIVTPTTPQRTTFQKNGRSYPRSIMYGKTFNID